MSVWRAVQSLALFPEENSKSKPNEASDICRGQTAPLDWWASFLDLCSSRTEAAFNTGIGYESQEQSLWPVFNRHVDLQDRQSWLYLLFLFPSSPTCTVYSEIRWGVNEYIHSVSFTISILIVRQLVKFWLSTHNKSD